MAKLFISAMFLLALYASTNELGWEGWEPQEIADLNMTCDETNCAPVCENYAPPPYCPNKLSNCSTGCLCMLLCTEPRIVCFQARDCMKRRWYLNRRKTTRH